MAATYSRTPTHLAKGKIRNGYIPYGSTRAICGGPTQIQTLAYPWMHGSDIWSPPSKPSNILRVLADPQTVCQIYCALAKHSGRSAAVNE
jgi:hypothetical protein